MNNQTLLQEYKGKWYIFNNVVAEEFGGYDENDNPIPTNQIHLSENVGEYDSYDIALVNAFVVDNEDPTEYGVFIEELAKDGSKVNIIE